MTTATDPTWHSVHVYYHDGLGDLILDAVRPLFDHLDSAVDRAYCATATTVRPSPCCWPHRPGAVPDLMLALGPGVVAQRRAVPRVRLPNPVPEDGGPGRPGPRRPLSSHTELLARPTAIAADPPQAITLPLPVTAARHAASLDPGQSPPLQTTDGTGHSGGGALSLPGDTGYHIPLPSSQTMLFIGIPRTSTLDRPVLPRR
jgi:hypothetical protein